MIQLKHEAIGEISWNFPEKIKTLDLTVLHYFIVEKILGIPGRQQRKSENIKFERNTDLCVKLVEQGEANLAVLTNPVSLKEVKEVCYSGFTLPQKSTYFYPKVICGFLYSSIKENEFTSFNSCF